jgi:hypothetical protein
MLAIDVLNTPAFSQQTDAASAATRVMAIAAIEALEGRYSIGENPG